MDGKLSITFGLRTVRSTFCRGGKEARLGATENGREDWGRGLEGQGGWRRLREAVALWQIGSTGSQRRQRPASWTPGGIELVFICIVIVSLIVVYFSE